jgi:glycogen(starch) synthase
MSEGRSASQLRVLLLGPYPPPHGGVEINIVAIQDFLIQSKINCKVINLTRHRKREGNGVYYPRGVFEVLRLLLKLKTQIIHLHIGGDVSWRLLGLGFVCSLLPGRKVVLTLHSGGYPSSTAGKAARRRSVRGFLFRRFDGLIAVNREIVDMFVRFGVTSQRIRLILPYALPAQVPNASLPDTMRVFFERHNPLLLTVSGLEPEYDLPLQIEALGAVRDKHSMAGLVIIGVGSLEKKIERFIGTKSYGEHILLAGDVSHDVVLRALSESDIFLRTTHYDGDSIAVREALHFGVPVIATDNGMRPPNVIRFPVSDREKFLFALLRLLGGPRRDESVTSGKESVNNLIAVLKFYEEVSQS